MSETLKNREAKMASKLLEKVDIKNADVAKHLDQLLFNLDWEIHAILSLIWAAKKLYDEDPQPDTGAFDKIERLLEMAEDKAEDLRDGMEEVQSSIRKSWHQSSGQDQRRNREGGVK